MSLDKMIKNLDKLEKQLPKIYAKGLKRTAKRVGDLVIDEMPIATGRLANNWNASPTKGGKGFDKNKRGTKEQAKKRLRKSIDKIKVKKNNKIYINNPATYGVNVIDVRKTNAAVSHGSRKAGQDLEEEFYQELRKLLG